MNRACSRSRLRNPLPFTPLNLFSTGEQGVWYDPSDMTTLFQDDAGTIPVTAADQVVGRILDKSGNNHHATQVTAASRPILRNSGVLWYLEFDGVDDFLVTGNVSFAATDKVSVFSGVRKLSDASVGIIVELDTVATNTGAFGLTAPSSIAAPNRGVGFRSQSAFIGGDDRLAPLTTVITAMANRAAPSIALRLDGAPFASSSAVQGAGNFANKPLYIGRRAGTTAPFTGYLYGLIIRGALTGDTGMLMTEKYLADQSGISI